MHTFGGCRHRRKRCPAAPRLPRLACGAQQPPSSASDPGAGQARARSVAAATHLAASAPPASSICTMVKSQNGCLRVEASHRLETLCGESRSVDVAASSSWWFCTSSSMLRSAVRRASANTPGPAHTCSQPRRFPCSN